MTTTVEHRRVQANGVNFHVASTGPEDAPPVVYLHGWPEGWMSFQPVMELLTESRVYVPDLRGFGETEHPRTGYDVHTLTDDIRALIEELHLDRPVLVSHDWGGALAWIFAHRYSHLIRQLVVVNCPHPRTLVRAMLRFEDLQTFRLPWVPFFQVPWAPEFFLTTKPGRRVMRLSFTLREGQKGTLNLALVDALVARFQAPADLRGPVEYYREMVRTHIRSGRRARLYAVYETPITVPTTLIWGEKDTALTVGVALQSHRDAGCEVEWRPLPEVGHFVALEAPGKLAEEVERVLARLEG